MKATLQKPFIDLLEVRVAGECSRARECVIFGSAMRQCRSRWTQYGESVGVLDNSSNVERDSRCEPNPETHRTKLFPMVPKSFHLYFLFRLYSMIHHVVTVKSFLSEYHHRITPNFVFFYLSKHGLENLI